MRSIIIGAGTYGEVYLEYLQKSDIDIVGFVDDNENLQGKTIKGVNIIGKIADLDIIKSKYRVDAVYCPIGNNNLRIKFLEYAKKIGYQTPSYIHPSVIIADSVEIGNCVYILPGTHIMPYTKIEDYVMISMGVNIAHHNLLSKGTFLSTGVNFGAGIIAKEKTYIGIGSTIMTGIHELGENCLIGAGAVVIKDVPDNAIVAGVPAKIIRYK